MHTQNDDLCMRKLSINAHGSVDAAQLGHGYIEHNDVRHRFESIFDSLAAVGSFADQALSDTNILVKDAAGGRSTAIHQRNGPGTAST